MRNSQKRKTLFTDGLEWEKKWYICWSFVMKTPPFVLVEGLTLQCKKLLIKKKKIKPSHLNAKKTRVGECGFCTVLACPPHPTQSLSLSISNSLSPKATTTYTLAFLCLLFLFCASYAFVYVCCLCSLFSVPANGGGIILWISCYYLIILSFLSFIFFYFINFNSHPLAPSGYPSQHDFSSCYMFISFHSYPVF